MTEKKIRILLAKPGLDGHDRGIKVIAAAFRDAGFEVVYTGLRQTPEQIVNAAMQEDVDAIGVSILSGAHMTLFPEIKRLMEEKGIGETILFGGGIIPAEDIKKLESNGIAKLFTPGATTDETVAYVRTAVMERAGKKSEDKIM